jgi:hypothetical protein
MGSGILGPMEHRDDAALRKAEGDAAIVTAVPDD